MNKKIVPNHGRIAVDCPQCKGKNFEVHVRVVPGSTDGHIEEVVCANCATWFRSQYGLLGGKMNVPLAPKPGPVTINVPIHEFKTRH